MHVGVLLKIFCFIHAIQSSIVFCHVNEVDELGLHVASFFRFPIQMFHIVLCLFLVGVAYTRYEEWTNIT
jgi:uncharacterized membrane protein